MFKLFSIILILTILIFLLRFKGNLLIKLFHKKKLKIHNNVSETQAKIYSSTLKKKLPFITDIKVYSKNERIVLKRKMEALFKGSKEDKLNALKIAKDLSDASTLRILRMGLKDMDSDIVEICAGLIDNFK
tara:strand:- start:1348 stop:1740 length:393 start_codon:yes stop_codon:yes gene_type:complete